VVHHYDRWLKLGLGACTEVHVKKRSKKLNSYLWPGGKLGETEVCSNTWGNFIQSFITVKGLSNIVFVTLHDCT